MSNEELDKLFKNKFENREVPFDESAWEDAARLIDAQQTKRKRGLVFWIIASMLVIGGSATAYWFAQQQDNNVVSNNGNSAEEQVIKTEKETFKKEDTKTSDTEITDKKEINQQESPVEGKDNSAPTSKQPSLPEAGFGEQKDESKDILVADKEVLNGGEKGEGISKEGDENKTEYKDKIDDEALERGTTNIEGNKQTEEDEELQRMLEEITRADTNYDVSVSDSIVKQEFIESDSIVASIEENEQDTFIDEEEAAKDKKQIKKSTFSHTLGLIGGFSSMQVFNANLAADSLLQAIIPFNDSKVENQFQFGLDFSYRLNNKWSLNSGLLYYKRQVLNNNRLTSNVTYGFGYKNITTYEVTKELTMVEWPIALQYNIFANGYIQLGGGVNFIVNSKNTLLEQETSTFGSTDVTSRDVTGYTGSFETITYNFMVGYKQYVLPRLSLGVQMISGLNDMTKNDVYNNNIFDRNTQYRVMLRYDIIRFRNNKVRERYNDAY